MKTNWYKSAGYIGLYYIFCETTRFYFGNWYMPILLGICIALISIEKQ